MGWLAGERAERLRLRGCRLVAHGNHLKAYRAVSDEMQRLEERFRKMASEGGTSWIGSDAPEELQVLKVGKATGCSLVALGSAPSC